jgi:hypothetical protein
LNWIAAIGVAGAAVKAIELTTVTPERAEVGAVVTRRACAAAIVLLCDKSASAVQAICDDISFMYFTFEERGHESVVCC